MNQYFSKQERENFIRLMILEGLLENIIDDYAKTNADKKFMGDARRVRTYVKKLLDYRQSFLDPVGRQNFLEAVDRLDVLFVPKREAVKHYQEIAKMQENIHFSREDFKDWFEFTIEHTCRTCTREDYENCKGRKILMTYDMYPFDPGAVGTCQYSYVQPGQGVGVVGEALLKAKGAK